MKFVIESESDLTEVTELERELDIPKDKILLMPQACEREDLATKSRWLAELCRRTGYDFNPRLHIKRFGNKGGT
ncbi:MAG: hypothetical protein QF619_06930 [Candidatus Binatia bacterium]|nr:hypothetical protein [Candidatus Binatia bacterium]